MQDNFWNDFFSTDKLLIPGAMTMLFGIILLVILSILNKEVTNIDVIIFLCLGFITGNVIKVKKMEKERLTSNEVNKIKANKNEIAKTSTTNTNTTKTDNNTQENKTPLNKTSNISNKPNSQSTKKASKNTITK